MHQLCVHLVNGDHFSRLGLATTLQSSPDILFQDGSASIEESMQAVLDQKPDVALFDTTAPDDSLPPAIQRIFTETPNTKVVVLSHDINAETMDWGYGIGVSAFIDKKTVDHHFAHALRLVAEGYTLFAKPEDGPEFPPRTTHKLQHDRYMRSLSPRDQELVRLVSQGASNTQIARNLHISEGSVKLYLARIMSRLGLTSRVQLAVIATECRMISSSEFNEANY